MCIIRAGYKKKSKHGRRHTMIGIIISLLLIGYYINYCMGDKAKCRI